MPGNEAKPQLLAGYTCTTKLFAKTKAGMEYGNQATHLDIGGNGNVVLEWDQLSVQRPHCHDLLLLLAELDAVDASKQLLQVGLDHPGVGGLAQDLQKIVVSDEIESGKDCSFLLQ